MKGLALRMNVVMDYKDSYAALPLTVGDFVKVSNVTGVIEEFRININGHAKIRCKNVIYSLATFDVQRLTPFSLTLKQLKEQLDFIISKKYLARLHGNTYEDINIIIRRSNIEDFNVVFGDTTKVEVLVKYGEYFNNN